MVESLNSDLANTLGNLVNRTISMSNQNFDGVITDTGVTEEIDEDLKKTVLETLPKVNEKMDELRVADALTEIFALFKRCNKYIDETTPWLLAKDPAKKARLSTVLYNLVESISYGAVLLEPFMPSTAKKILSQLHAQSRSIEEMRHFGLYESGTKITDSPKILFARLDVMDIMEKVNAKAAELEAAQAAKEPVIDIEAKPNISYEDFSKLQFQIGEVLSCEAVKKADKLLCSQVKIGSTTRQIVSGIRSSYTPEEMVGKKVLVLVNLEPRKIRGLMSEGMLLCAEDENGVLSLLTAEKPMPPGAEVC